MSKESLKAVIHKQIELFDFAVKDKLHRLTKDDDFYTDVFEQAYVGEDELNALSLPEKKIDAMLDAIYSHRVDYPAPEMRENRLVSYQQKISSLRGIGMADDYYATRNS